MGKQLEDYQAFFAIEACRLWVLRNGLMLPWPRVRPREQPRCMPKEVQCPPLDLVLNYRTYYLSKDNLVWKRTPRPAWAVPQDESTPSV